MKFLLLGQNHASTMNSLKTGLEENGIEVLAISYDLYRSAYNNYDKIKCVYPAFLKSCPRILKGILWRFYSLKSLPWFKKNIRNADVVIYFSSPTFTLFYDATLESSYELRLIDKFVKRKYVWFTGSDIRNPETELSINPFFKRAWDNTKYEYRKLESVENSNRLQALFKMYNFKPIVWDMSVHINKSIFPEHVIVPHSSICEVISKTENKRIQIVHAPSAPVAKGSEYIISVIDQLKKVRNDFDFHLLQNISNNEYQRRLGDADILIDQIIWGSYGVASMQALQAGKAVVAYLSESNINDFFSDECPIINANPETLYQKLLELLDNKDLNQIKINGQKYYNKMHSPNVVAKKLLQVIRNCKF